MYFVTTCLLWVFNRCRVQLFCGQGPFVKKDKKTSLQKNFTKLFHLSGLTYNKSAVEDLVGTLNGGQWAVALPDTHMLLQLQTKSISFSYSILGI